jgi:hypothetical protein
MGSGLKWGTDYLVEQEALKVGTRHLRERQVVVSGARAFK